MKEGSFFIVGLGASAEGIQAIYEFFENIPDNPGIAFVVVQHLKRDHKSRLSLLISKHTSLEVVEIENGMEVKPNTIYVLKEGKKVIVKNGYLLVRERPEEEKINAAIDEFICALAADQKERAIGIILSGLGSDGTRGAIKLHENGGVVMVQEPHSAQFNSMPLNAIAYDSPDYILPPAELSKCLMSFVQRRELLENEKS